MKKSLEKKYNLRFSDCECLEILIVDDQAFNLSAASLALKHYNPKLDVANNGQDAYDKILTYRAFEDCGCRNYRLVLMDLEMPIMDGFETARKVRREFPDEPIVIYGCSAFEQQL